MLCGRPVHHGLNATGGAVSLFPELANDPPCRQEHWHENNHEQKIFHIYPLDVSCEIIYIEGAGVRPRTLWPYQSSNLRIAAVIRPEIVPARMLATRLSIPLGRAAGFRLRRFLFAIALTSFLIPVYYGYTVFSRWNIVQKYDLTFVHFTTVKPYQNVIRLFRVMIWYPAIKKRLGTNGIQRIWLCWAAKSERTRPSNSKRLARPQEPRQMPFSLPPSMSF